MSYNQATLGTCPRSSGDRASASGAESHRFESCRGHHTFTRCVRTHVLSRIYLSLCYVFTLLRTAFMLLRIASWILCTAFTLLRTAFTLLRLYAKKYVLHVSQHTAHIILIMERLTGSNAIYGVLLASPLQPSIH